MYAIKKNKRVLSDGKEITTYSREIPNACILTVEAGTSGYVLDGGNSGTYTYFRIKDEAGTQWNIHSNEDESIEVELVGNCEVESIITALKFITQVLEEQSGYTGVLHERDS